MEPETPSTQHEIAIDVSTEWGSGDKMMSRHLIVGEALAGDTISSRDIVHSALLILCRIVSPLQTTAL
ncbi:MAG: hypothetical protein JSV82_06480 [Planctomycetota bacterium]|nr:MAG: hypothetical protein JSV82_06480 [Planctomycetota bacterium]